jgi:hypothetical protein
MGWKMKKASLTASSVLRRHQLILQQHRYFRTKYTTADFTDERPSRDVAYARSQRECSRKRDSILTVGRAQYRVFKNGLGAKQKGMIDTLIETS